MTTMTIHYTSPAGDPFKIPRPHRVTLDGNRVQAVEGGEIGPIRSLLGFCPTVTPDVDDWHLTHVAEALADPAALAGQYVQMVDGRGGMFGYEVAIKRVEVSA